MAKPLRNPARAAGPTGILAAVGRPALLRRARSPCPRAPHPRGRAPREVRPDSPTDDGDHGRRRHGPDTRAGTPPGIPLGLAHRRRPHRPRRPPATRPGVRRPAPRPAALAAAPGRRSPALAGPYRTPGRPRRPARPAATAPRPPRRDPARRPGRRSPRPRRAALGRASGPRALDRPRGVGLRQQGPLLDRRRPARRRLGRVPPARTAAARHPRPAPARRRGRAARGDPAARPRHAHRDLPGGGPVDHPAPGRADRAARPVRPRFPAAAPRVPQRHRQHRPPAGRGVPADPRPGTPRLARPAGPAALRAGRLLPAVRGRREPRRDRAGGADGVRGARLAGPGAAAGGGRGGDPRRARPALRARDPGHRIAAGAGVLGHLAGRAAVRRGRAPLLPGDLPVPPRRGPRRCGDGGRVRRGVRGGAAAAACG